MAGQITISLLVARVPFVHQLRVVRLYVNTHAPLLPSTQAYNALAHSNTGRYLVGRFCLSSTLPLSILLGLLLLGKFVEFVSRDLLFVIKSVKEALRPYTQVCCKTRMEAAVEDRNDMGTELQESPTQGGISKKNLRVNVYPPYSRRCEIAYPNKAAVPIFPSERYVSSGAYWKSAISFLPSSKHKAVC